MNTHWQYPSGLAACATSGLIFGATSRAYIASGFLATSGFFSGLIFDSEDQLQPHQAHIPLSSTAPE
jgi:hypothetical protein